ncbi:uncharacterized protein LOC113402509 isoform X2 [Vanessa tameamea]|uniref:Uncharacterized protein LOC113402509 isoform X2 n=1 Tax=Vanessa tameamea TaxID=334116 RepID=A0ABM4AM31_VANTA
MFRLLTSVTLFVLSVNGDFLTQERTRGATLCNDVQCVFEKSGFLVDKHTLNKEVYRAHLRQWLEGHKGWEDAIEKAIKDCVDKDLRQYLDYPCRAYDVFTCTGIAMLKKCPKDAWKC